MNAYSKFILLAFLLSGAMACDTYEEVLPSPQEQRINESQAELVRVFSQLTGGDESACNLIFDPTEIPDILCNIISDARQGSEIVFLVDKTGSMEDDIDEVRRNINRIIDCLPPGCRLGAATYGDNRADGAAWYTSTDLNSDYGIARTFINEFFLVGGGDAPESVYDAIYRVLEEMSWSDCSAPDKIIVMGDAPPHTGFRTDYEVEDVLAKADSICPGTEFYPVIVLDI